MIDVDALKRVLADALRPVIREELEARDRARGDVESDIPHPSSWWAERLGCSAESLVKKAKRGSIESTRVGGRWYFTRSQIEGKKTT